MELIPGLPEEIAMECLLRLPSTCQGAARRVCRMWRSLVDDPEFYRQRRQSGRTLRLLCLVQALPSSVDEGETTTRPAVGEEARPKLTAAVSPAYGVTLFDPERMTWRRLPAVPGYPAGLPLFCQLASTDGKLVTLGGWDPATWAPLRDVWVFDFAAGGWRRGADLPVERSFFAAAGGAGGRVFVAGGHDGAKTAQRSAWAYNLRQDAWEELPPMGEERDECEGVVLAAGPGGEEFWVVSGYGTEGQGRFAGNAEVFDVAAGRWRRVEGVWPEGRCPRGCVGVAGGSAGGAGLVCWAEEEAAVRVGTCAVGGGGGRVMVVGAVCPGAPAAFYLAEAGEGRGGRLERLAGVPPEFAGFVQSGCCMEL